MEEKLKVWILKFFGFEFDIIFNSTMYGLYMLPFSKVRKKNNVKRFQGHITVI